MSSVVYEDATGALPQELADLYRRYGPAAYRLAVRRVHDRDLAADVVQEAFLSLWRSRHSFQADRGSVGGLLGTLVHRRAVELLRRRASWPATELLDEYHAETLTDAAAGPDQLACDSDQRSRVLARSTGCRRPNVRRYGSCGCTITGPATSPRCSTSRAARRRRAS